MDSGTTSRRSPEDEATAREDEAFAPAAGWLRIHAIGFERGLPPLLIAALGTCAPRVRIESGGQGVGPGDDPGDRDAGLHLVAMSGETPAIGLQRIAATTGRCLAVGLDGRAGATLPAIAAGAAGVLYLHDGHDDLVRALHAAASGAPALTATAARELIAHACGESAAMPVSASIAVPVPAPTTIRLTAREREIIALADRGCTFTQAARLMGVQVSTVYTHVRRLYDKLSVNSLPQALHEARRAGLL